MRDVHRNPRFAADANRLRDRAEQANGIGILIAHVRIVITAHRSDDFRQLNDLLRLCETPGNVKQARGQAEGTFFDGAAHELFHVLELFGRGLDVAVA